MDDIPQSLRREGERHGRIRIYNEPTNEHRGQPEVDGVWDLGKGSLLCDPEGDVIDRRRGGMGSQPG